MGNVIGQGRLVSILGKDYNYSSFSIDEITVYADFVILKRMKISTGNFYTFIFLMFSPNILINSDSLAKSQNNFYLCKVAFIMFRW